LNSDGIDAGIEQVLAQVGKFSGDDRAFLILFSRDGESMDTLYEWCDEGVEAQAHRVQGRPAASLPWLIGKIRAGQPVMVPDVEALPPEASLDQDECRTEQILSVLLLPLRFQGKVVGILGFDTVRHTRVWDAEAQISSQLIADLLTSVMARRQAEEDLRDAQQLLEKRVEERTRANERRGRAANALRDILKVLNSNRALPDVLNYIVVQSCKLLNASATLIRKADLEHDRATSDASYQMPAEFDVIRDTQLYYNANDLILMSRRPVLIADLHATYTPVLEMGTGVDDVQRAYIQALLKHFAGMLSVPLFIRDEIFGSLTFFFQDHRSFSEEDIQLAMALGDQAALAIENARLYREEHVRREEAERRRQVAEGLRDILAVLNSNRSLEEILGDIVAQATHLLHTDAVAIYRLLEEEGVLVIHASDGLDEDFVRNLRIPVAADQIDPAPVSVSDTREDSGLLSVLSLSAGERGVVERLLDTYRAYLFVPLVGKQVVYGAFTLYYHQARSFSGEEIGLAVAFADQASLAIENARLRSESEQNAVLMERNRLARDLHDAVTQTLFSASLIAEVLPRIWQRDPQEGWRRLEELRQLSRGALAEMRTLLLELRPSALTEARLSDLLKQLGEAVSGRARLPITLSVDGEFPLHPDVQVFFYRIAQEALNNILKHAAATQAGMTLQFEDSPQGRSVRLTIQDDGQGFEPANVPSNHLGLGIMQERAQAVHADFHIDSAPGQGTTVTVTWRER
jgi:signal transduction histidine kinase